MKARRIKSHLGFPDAQIGVSPRLLFYYCQKEEIEGVQHTLAVALFPLCITQTGAGVDRNPALLLRMLERRVGALLQLRTTPSTEW